VQVVFSTIGAVIEHIRTDKLRALAVTATRRVDVLPDIPALGEFVSGYEARWGSDKAGFNEAPHLVANFAELLKSRIRASIRTGVIVFWIEGSHAG
jgi:hypothetical protein